MPNISWEKHLLCSLMDSFVDIAMNGLWISTGCSHLFVCTLDFVGMETLSVDVGVLEIVDTI